LFDEELDFEDMDFEDDFWVAAGEETAYLPEVVCGGGEVAAGRGLSVMMGDWSHARAYR
jgi:hypothetical protein